MIVAIVDVIVIASYNDSSIIAFLLTAMHPHELAIYVYSIDNRSLSYYTYHRDALCLGESEEYALENFRAKLREAVRKSLSVSINWYFHNVARAGN